jgi:hypothetical protein
VELRRRIGCALQIFDAEHLAEVALQLERLLRLIRQCVPRQDSDPCEVVEVGTEPVGEQPVERFGPQGLFVVGGLDGLGLADGAADPERGLVRQLEFDGSHGSIGALADRPARVDLGATAEQRPGRALHQRRLTDAVLGDDERRARLQVKFQLAECAPVGQGKVPDHEASLPICSMRR